MSAEEETREAGEATGERWSARHPKQASAVYLASYLVAAGGAGALAPRVESVAGQVALVLVAWVVTVALSLLLVLSLCRVSLRPGGEVAWVLGMMVAFCLARPVVFAIVGRAVGHGAAGMRVAAALSVMPQQELLGNAALVAWAAFLGKLVSRIVKEGKLVLPVAVVAAVADTITVFWGPVARVSEAAPEVAKAFSASGPLAPPEGVAVPILAAVGIGDFLFLALFLAAALRHRMEPVKTLWAALVLTLGAALVIYVWPERYGIPGLPFIGAAVVWANWRHLRFTREERRALAIVGLLVAAAALTAWALLRQ